MDKPIQAKDVVLTSLLVDCLDVALSILVAVLSGSVIMFSQVLQGLADLTCSALLMIGLQSSKRVEDRTHPFGYGREIYFWTLIASLVMFAISSFFSIHLGWERFLHPAKVENVYLAFGVLGLTLITNGYAFWLSLIRLLRNRSWKSVASIFFRSSLVETKTTFTLDLMGAMASLFGIASLIIYQVTGDERMDGLGAIFIGLVIAVFAYMLIMGIKDLLIGRSASREIEDRIIKATKNIREVRSVVGLKTMHIGSERLLVNIDVNLNAQLTTREIEKLIDAIKKEVRRNVPSVKHIQVELEGRE